MRKAIAGAIFVAVLLAGSAVAQPVGGGAGAGAGGSAGVGASVGAGVSAGGGAAVLDIARTEQLMAGFTDVLNTSTDRTSLLVALGMLRDAAWTPALPAARRLAVSQDDAEVRRAAVKLLGWHGEARDWELIMLGLYSDDEADVLAAIWAVEHYGDERGIGYLDDVAAQAGLVVAAAAKDSRARLEQFLEELAGPSARDLTVADVPRLRSEMISARLSGLDDAGAQAEALATTMRLVLRRAAAEDDP